MNCVLAILLNINYLTALAAEARGSHINTTHLYGGLCSSHVPIRPIHSVNISKFVSAYTR
jgi:hypothetical protein